MSFPVRSIISSRLYKSEFSREKATAMVTNTYLDWTSRMKNFIIFLVLALGFVGEVSLARNPGIRLRLTDKGFAYAAKIAKEIIDEKIKTLKINDVSGKAKTPIGRIKYTLSSIKVDSYSLPTLTLKTKPGVGLELSVSGVSINLRGDWHYKTESWVHIRDHGSFTLKADGVSFDAVIRLGADSQGHPTIAPGGCSSSIGGVNVHFSGGASWLYNLFTSKIEHSIQDSLKSEMCKAANSAITKEGAKSFARFPIKKKLDKYAVIDYALINSPNSTFSFLDVNLKGEFESVAHPSEAPFSPEPLPEGSHSTSMVYGWITDYTLNTAGFAYMEAGFLNHTFTPDEFPKNFSYPLNTKTFKKLIPPLYEKYPNRPMKLKVYPTKIPNVSSSTSGINLLVDCNIEMFVDDDETSVYALTLGLTFSASLTVGIKETNLTVHSTFLRLKASLVRSAIGDITRYIKALQFYLDVFVNGMIMRKFNKMGEKGFPLPVNDGVKLLNPQISTGKSFTMVSVDVSYTPSADQDVNQEYFRSRKIRIV